MRCRDCHYFVMFNPKKGLCMLAQEFLTEEEFRDPRVACDFWKPYRKETQMINGELKYVRVKNENVYDRDAESNDAQERDQNNAE